MRLFQMQFLLFIIVIMCLNAYSSQANAVTLQKPADTEPTPYLGFNLLRDNSTKLSGCLTTKSYSNKSIMNTMGHAIKIMDTQKTDTVNEYKIQPRFSGLKGPVLSLLRSDFDKVKNGSGSVNEIYHNARTQTDEYLPCEIPFYHDEDTEIIHKIDLLESNQSPLFASKIRSNNRLHFGGYFLGTASASQVLYDNLERDSDLQTINRLDAIRQDELGFVWQGLSVDRLMLSSFFTPKSNVYTSLHGGYLEDMFFGFGGELLYRPFDKNYAVGGEIWRTTKRVPYLGAFTLVDKDNTQTSALLNLWYDLPSKPLSFGLSLGRFLDGDIGFQIKSNYKPNNGWKLENSLTLSNQSDKGLNNNEKTNMIIGTRLTMPLGEIPYVTESLRQTLVLEPFARDKGQRIDNPYPLYDLTYSWSAKNIHRHWSDIVQK